MLPLLGEEAVWTMEQLYSTANMGVEKAGNSFSSPLWELFLILNSNHTLPLICCVSYIPWQISKCGRDIVKILKIWQLHQTYLIVSLKIELTVTVTMNPLF